VASEVAKDQVSRLREELDKCNIEFKTLGEVVREVIHDVDEWKASKPNNVDSFSRTLEVF